MPTYERQCEKCDHQFDVRTTVARRNEPQECPECGHPETRRAISKTAFSLKGGGWANDGYSKP